MHRELGDLEATRALAVSIARNVDPPQTIVLNGTLGAGKTQWIRFFAAAMGVAPELVTSPTYVLHQQYRGEASTLHHFDFYRLESESQVWDLGIDELFETADIVLIEWGDRFPACLPDDHLVLTLDATSSTTRHVRLSATGPRSHAIVERLGK